MSKIATLVEVGPRDGFQSVDPFIPTAKKIEILRALYSSGLRRIEATSFVSDAALPQLSDAKEIVAAAAELPGLDIQVLVPNERHADRALDAGVNHLSIVVSASERHNLSNVRRTPSESVNGFRAFAERIPESVQLRLNIATAFDCPFDGPVAPDLVDKLTGQLLELWPRAEIAICDTTGRANPSQVSDLFEHLMNRYAPEGGWAFHGHDTYGLGAANVLAAWNSGVHIFDASIAGLGGCPFAPGATGNVATEDLVWMFTRMQALEGIDLATLIKTATHVCALSGAQVGGRVRVAELARAAKSARKVVT